MNIKKSLFTGLLLLGSLSMAAQEQQPKTEYVFQPHWYVQAQFGGQYTLGEVNFGKLVSPNAQVGIGYNFSPVLGARFAVNAWQSKGGSRIYGESYTWKWSYVAPAVDLTLNFSNLICGFNPNRVFNLTGFIGAGANIAFDNNQAADRNREIYSALHPGAAYDANQRPLWYLWGGTETRFFGQAGLMADFRVSKAVSLGIELQANTVGDRYNSKRAGNSDWYFNALAGVKINLGKTYTTREVKPCEPEIRYVDRIVEKVVEKPVPAPVANTARPKEKLRRDVFFTISSVVIPKAEMQKVEDVANYLNKYPEATVTVTGYADKGTGNAKINKRLAQNRANTVVKCLTTKYGIPASRITADSKGDTEQPFAENAKNRVSICIAE